MLQHNVARTHLAHTAVVALHALCCGLPALALMTAMALGTAAGSAAWLAPVQQVHSLLHGHESWVLALSALLVLAGGLGELAARRQASRGFPALFALSAAALLVNVGVYAVHQWA